MHRTTLRVCVSLRILFYVLLVQLCSFQWQSILPSLFPSFSLSLPHSKPFQGSNSLKDLQANPHWIIWSHLFVHDEKDMSFSIFYHILPLQPPPYLRLFHTSLFVRRSPCMLHIRFLSLFHSSTSFHLAFFSVNLMRFAFNAILSYHAKYTLSMSERVRVLKRRKPTQMKLCLMYHKENNYWCWETHSHARAAYIVVFKR